jgi:transposase
VVYLQKVLAPMLAKDDILVMDNSSIHTSKLTRDAIDELGINVFYLPPYSPDLNPIELSWSKMKALLRKLKPRSFEEIEAAMKIALVSFTESDLIHWFEHDGYVINL